MTRPHLLYLHEIVESIEKIQRYIKGLSYDEFCESEIVIDAVLRNLEVIGEAGTKVPKEVQEAYPQVPWRLMKGMRNILIHEYFGVDLEIVWKTIQESLPDLQVTIQKALSEQAKAD